MTANIVNHLAHRGVIVLPGSAFSDEQNYIRISFAGNIDEVKKSLKLVSESIQILLKKTV